MAPSIEDFDIYLKLDENKEGIKAVKLDFSIFRDEATTNIFYINAAFINDANQSIPKSSVSRKMMYEFAEKLKDLIENIFPDQQTYIENNYGAPLIVKLSEKITPSDLDDRLQAGIKRSLNPTIMAPAKIDGLHLTIQYPNKIAERILLNSFEYRKSAIHKALTAAFGNYATTEKIDDLTSVLTGLSRLYMHSPIAADPNLVKSTISDVLKISFPQLAEESIAPIRDNLLEIVILPRHRQESLSSISL